MNIKKILESNGLHEARVLSACDICPYLRVGTFF